MNTMFLSISFLSTMPLILMLLTTHHSLLVTSSPVHTWDSSFTDQNDVISTVNRKLDRRRRIVGGDTADIEDNPWIVQLFTPYTSNNSIQSNITTTPNPNPIPEGSPVFSCGGSIISSRYILTAAHCASDKIVTTITAPSDITVATGQARRAKNGTLQVEQIFIHENYTRVYGSYDIALLKLSHPGLDLKGEGGEVERSIALPSQGVTPDVLNSLHCKVAGWGYGRASGISEVLKEVNQTVARQHECSEFFLNKTRSGRDYSKTTLCVGAANISEGGVSACHGDSGGPLACQKPSDKSWFLAGIVSYGPGGGCGEPGWYAVYTEVSEYLAWVYNLVDDDATTVDDDVGYTAIIAAVAGVSAFLTAAIVLVAAYCWWRRGKERGVPREGEESNTAGDGADKHK